MFYPQTAQEAKARIRAHDASTTFTAKARAGDITFIIPTLAAGQTSGVIKPQRELQQVENFIVTSKRGVLQLAASYGGSPIDTELAWNPDPSPPTTNGNALPGYHLVGLNFDSNGIRSYSDFIPAKLWIGDGKQPGVNVRDFFIEGKMQFGLIVVNRSPASIRGTIVLEGFFDNE